MLTTAILTILTLATTPELAKAENDVATATALEQACWSPKECNATAAMLKAAEEALSAARTVVGPALVAGEPDPFAPPATYTNPFQDEDEERQETIELMAGFQLNGLESSIEELAKP